MGGVVDPVAVNAQAAPVLVGHGRHGLDHRDHRPHGVHHHVAQGARPPVVVRRRVVGRRDGRSLDRPGARHLLELGGDSGLRGYPLRYQTGESRMLISIEERFFTDWYPFRLVRVGFAVFADAGRTWGENPAGGTPIGWLKDVGFGLRLAPTRSGSNKVFHVDLAFPLDGDSSIDSVQFLLTSSRSF